MQAVLRGLRLLQKLELVHCITFPIFVFEANLALKLVFGGRMMESLQVNKLFYSS